MKTLNPTQTDRSTLTAFRLAIQIVRARCVKNMPDYKASEWQFAETVLAEGYHYGLKRGRLRRLVALGWVEEQPSDGHGPSVRETPNINRYL